MSELGAFFIGVMAVALATPVLYLSFVERPIQARVPRAAVVLGVIWWLGFLAAAAVVGVRGGGMGVMGLLLAASELAGAATIWFARSSPGGGGGGWGGGGGGGDAGNDEPRGPLVGGLPEDYWNRWEAEMQPSLMDLP
jgi:hypothetical protein